MKFETATIERITESQLNQAAEITARGFSRPNDIHNFDDTKAHINGVDLLQVATFENQLAGYVGFRRLLWQPCN